MLASVEISSKSRVMIRAIIDDCRRRVWAILIGMAALANTVEAVTIIIHDRIG
jgi:hypothetical protein